MPLPRSSIISALALIACLAGPMPSLTGQVNLQDTCDLAFVNSVFLNPGPNGPFNNFGSTVSGISPSCITTAVGQPPLVAADIWFLYGAQATCSVSFTITAPTIFIPILAIYDGNSFTPGSCATLPELACTVGGPTLTVNVNAGDVLFLQFVNIIAGNTGALNIDVSTSFGLSIGAPTGPGSLQVENSCGTPGSNYITAFTALPGAFPNGWFFGVDITLPDLITQVSFGAPFSGNLDASGGSFWSAPAGIPSGIRLHAVTVQLDPTGVPLEASPPVLFVTP